MYAMGKAVPQKHESRQESVESADPMTHTAKAYSRQESQGKAFIHSFIRSGRQNCNMSSMGPGRVTDGQKSRPERPIAMLHTENRGGRNQAHDHAHCDPSHRDTSREGGWATPPLSTHLPLRRKSVWPVDRMQGAPKTGVRG